MKLSEKLGPSYGEIIPVSPLIANMVSSDVSSYSDSRLQAVINKIRLGAARQHLDVVLIYELYSQSDKKNNILAIADLTIIGAFLLPSRSVKVESFSHAMLIDVVQGYPYGTVETSVEKGEKYSSTFGQSSAKNELQKSIESQTTFKLTNEVEKMLKQLRLELAEKRSAENK